jgi:hypothetical protein
MDTRTTPLYSPRANASIDYFVLFGLGDRRSISFNLSPVASKMKIAIHIEIPMIFVPKDSSSLCSSIFMKRESSVEVFS